MVPSFLQSQKKARIGNDAGWALKFFRPNPDGSLPADAALTLRADDYHAEIQASLPSGLEGGNYSISVEGLSDRDYRTLRQLVPLGDSVSPAIAKLYLYWRDVATGLGGSAASLLGVADLTRSSTIPDEALVSVLAVQSVSRKAGDRRYETTIQAQEWVYRALAQRVRMSICTGSLRAALNAVSRETKIPFQLWLDEFPAAVSDVAQRLVEEASNFEQGSLYSKEIQDIAKALEDGTNQRGRGMLLIRDGKLHIGPRSIPLPSTAQSPATKELTLEAGLIEVESIAAASGDPNFDQSQSDRSVPRHPQFRLTLKGRGDLKPGDFVKVDLPPEDFPTTQPSFGSAVLGIAGPLIPSLSSPLQNATALYINSVQHRLGRTSGFITVAIAVQVDEADPWDHHTPGGSRSATEESSTSADSGTRSAHAVRQLATDAANSRRLPEVGEIRAIQTSGQGSATTPPGQTSTVWQGLVASEGRSYQANRLAIQRQNPFILTQVPYVSPFAWGKCGLVMPRYPGTRVVMLHRNGQSNDPIEIGALWEAGRGPDSQAGDWWLILPVNVPEAKRSSLMDSEVPQAHTGKVTQDLIDAKGGRIIEVGELTIRVGKERLKDAGTRPDPPDDSESITIEHTKKQSKIVIKPDGSITITATKIDLDAGSDGDITMTAQNVNINVQQSVNIN